MQLLQSRTGKRRFSKWVRRLLVVALLVAAFGLWKGYEYLQPRYLLWKQERALNQAKDFIARHDAANAQVALEVAFKAVPGNPETLRVAADMLEQVGAPQAMRLRRAVVQVAPDSAEDAAKLVFTCLRFRDYNAAKDVLSSTAPKVAIQPPMLRAALAYAIATDNAPIADHIFNLLREKYPNEPGLKQAQALLRLRHPREEKRLAARQELEDIARADPRLSFEINREFAADALQRRDYAEVKLRQKLILADPAATFTDHLQKANIDLLIDHAPFERLFAELAPLAAKSAPSAGEFAQWLLVQNRAAQLDQWIASLPEPLRADPVIRAADGDAIAQLGDWDRLSNLLADGAWGPISKDTLRLALAAKTVDNPAHPSLRVDTWDMTLDSAKGNLSALRILQRLASLWKWGDESERTLWAIARTFPDQTWAHQALFNLYRDKKDTTRMRDVVDTLRQSDGAVPRYQHDWALLTLLLEPSVSWNPAKDTMRQLYESERTNATYGTGYAFALAQAGKGAEAVAVVEKMTEDERNYPPRAPYLAFVYGVAKKAEPLDKAIALGQNVPFLPEETYLFTRAREEFNRKPEKPKPVLDEPKA